MRPPSRPAADAYVTQAATTGLVNSGSASRVAPYAPSKPAALPWTSAKSKQKGDLRQHRHSALAGAGPLVGLRLPLVPALRSPLRAPDAGLQDDRGGPKRGCHPGG